MKTLKRNATIVFINSKDKNRRFKLPPNVAKAFVEKSMARTIPKLVVVSNDLGEIWDSRAEKGVHKMDEKGLKQAKRRIRDIQKGKVNPSDLNSYRDDASLFWPQDNYTNKGYHGRFMKIENDTLFLSESPPVKPEASNIGAAQSGFINRSAFRLFQVPIDPIYDLPSLGFVYNFLSLQYHGLRYRQSSPLPTNAAPHSFVLSS